MSTESSNQRDSAQLERLGDYELVAEIGADELATWFLARRHDRPNGAPVVVKRFHSLVAAQPDLLSVLLEDLRAASQIDHRQIVKILDVTSSFVAVEHVSGQALSALIEVGNRRKLPLNLYDATQIVGDTANALDHAHSYGDGELIHRAISPATVLVRYDGEVEIEGFGMARGRALLPGATAMAVPIGYASPEQLTQGTVDARSDVFSLGVVLWEALTLRRLFPASDDAAALALLHRVRPARPSASRRVVPRELDDICLRALALDPNQRQQSARELRIEIENFLWTANYSRESNTLAKYMTALFADRQGKHQELLNRADQRPADDDSSNDDEDEVMFMDSLDDELPEGTPPGGRLVLPLPAPGTLEIPQPKGKRQLGHRLLSEPGLDEEVVTAVRDVPLPGDEAVTSVRDVEEEIDLETGVVEQPDPVTAVREEPEGETGIRDADLPATPSTPALESAAARKLAAAKKLAAARQAAAAKQVAISKKRGAGNGAAAKPAPAVAKSVVAPRVDRKIVVPSTTVAGAVETAKPAAKTDVKPAAKTEAKPAAKTEAKPAAKTEAKPPEKPEAKPARKPEIEPVAKTEAKLPEKPATKPAEKPEVEPVAKTEAKPPEKPEVKPPAKTEAKPPAKTEAKPPAKTEAKPPAKPDVKPPAKTEVKPPAKPEVKPPAKPEVKAPAETEAKPPGKPADDKPTDAKPDEPEPPPTKPAPSPLAATLAAAKAAAKLGGAKPEAKSTGPEPAGDGKPGKPSKPSPPPPGKATIIAPPPVAFAGAAGATPSPDGAETPSDQPAAAAAPPPPPPGTAAQPAAPPATDTVLLPTPERSEWRKLAVVLVAALAILVGVVFAFGGGSEGEKQSAKPSTLGPTNEGELPVSAYDLADGGVMPADAAVIANHRPLPRWDAGPPDAGADDAGPPDAGPPDASTEIEEPTRHEPVVAHPNRDRGKVSRAKAQRYYKQGVRLFVEGRTSSARKMFRNATRADPGYAPAYRGLGLAYERAGNTERAIRALRKYLELDPNAQDAESIRGRIAHLGG